MFYFFKIYFIYLFLLFLSESLRFFDGVVEFLYHLIVAFIWRQIESIETSMRSGQPGVFAYFLDAEALRTVAPWKKNILN